MVFFLLKDIYKKKLPRDVSAAYKKNDGILIMTSFFLLLFTQLSQAQVEGHKVIGLKVMI